MTEEVLKIIVQFEKSPATPEKKALQCELEYFEKKCGDYKTDCELFSFGRILADDFPAEFAKIKAGLDYDLLTLAFLSVKIEDLGSAVVLARQALITAIKDFIADQLELIELEKTA